MSEIKRIMLVDNGPGSRYFGEPPATEAVEDVLKFVEKQLEEIKEKRQECFDRIKDKNYEHIL